MSDLATRLMMNNKALMQQSALPTAIFGSAGNVRHALQTNTLPVRLGFWPIRSADKPEIAMGLLAVLGYLLERYQGVRVYRVLARVDGKPESYVWAIHQSQFDVDDWQIEDLDDNVGIWGVLNGWNLTLEIESDLSGDDGTQTLNFRADSLTELVRTLPQVASAVTTILDVTDLNLLAPLYTNEDWESSNLAAALEQLFYWERRLYLWMWGQEWTQQQILLDADRLLAATKSLGELGAWLVSQALARAFMFMGVEDEFLIPAADNIIDTFESSPLPANILSIAIYGVQFPQQAYAWLEAEFDAGTANTLTHLVAAELYRRGGQFAEAVDVMQAAIEDGMADAVLFRRYADFLVALEYNGLKVEHFVLIPNARSKDNLLREAVEAYEQSLKLEPNNVVVLGRQILQFLEIGGYDERLWRGFDRLVGIDETGEQTRQVIDLFHQVDDLTPAVDILKQHIAQNPDQISAYLSLASVYILDEDSSSAITLLNQARQMASDEQTISEIERLRLSAEDPEFEMTLAEITDILNAGNNIETGDVEFLERVIEEVPDYAEIYILLARAYLGWGETSSALETLLDGHKHAPDDPDILVLLSEVVWDSGETDLAFSYLDRGINKNPQHVPLLALAGQYLFEDGQEDAAKAYLLKAESISPNDPTLIRVRHHIARSLR